MVTRLKALFSSLGARLLIPLFIAVAALLAVQAFVSFRSTKEHFLRFVAGEADRSSGLIRRATHDGMLLNRLNEVQTTIERIAEGPDVAAIRVYGKDGTIVLSSDRREIGQKIQMQNATCSRCHVQGAVRGVRMQSADVLTVGGDRVVRQLTVIPNERACSRSGCHQHGRNQAALGVLDVQMATTGLETALKGARQQFIWTTLILILILGIVAVFMVRQLEEKVDHKTAELKSAQKQVLHMEKMSSLGKLSATVAHELNNPISGMLTYARLVERELDDQPLNGEVRTEVNRYLHLVQRECARCGDIVQNLLVFARRSSTELATIDLNEIVDRSLMLIRHHLEISRITLETKLLEGNSDIVADAGQLQQALVALFVNSVEAMKDRGGTLRVQLSATKQDVLIDVADTGIGIAPDALPLIFEPFFSTKGSESGVGLGLAVVYGIVHRHGGTIEVESEQGVGTAFHIRLPRVAPTEPKKDASYDSSTSSDPGSRRRVFSSGLA